MSLKSNLVSLKDFAKGSKIGYGATHTTEKDSKIAILPIGYADGYPRLISNRGAVLVQGKRAPVVGRVSMDLMAIDVTEIPEAQIYDEAVLIGEQSGDRISIEEVASWAETISYEIMTGIQERVSREYV